VRWIVETFRQNVWEMREMAKMGEMAKMRESV